MFPLPWSDIKIPKYNSGSYGRWILSTTHGRMPGYFTAELHDCNVPALRRKEHGKEIVWMSLAWMELESHMPHIAAAHGHTVVMGLGMGMYLYNIIQKPEVTRVTVIERDKSVFRLLRDISEYNRWPGIEKVKIVIEDARKWKAKEPVDFLYADFWKLMGDDKAMPWVKALLPNVRPKLFGYWTQEFDFVSYMREHKIDISKASVDLYNEFAATFGYRMVGQNDERYAILCCMAVILQSMVSCRDDPFLMDGLRDRYNYFVNRYSSLLREAG